MTEQEMTELAARVAKSLRWAAFLAACTLTILLIDLQLKRSIGRQAVAASALLSRRLADHLAEGGPDGARADMAAAGDAGRDPGSSGRDGVGRDAPVAAGDDDPGSAAPAAADRRAPRAGKRLPGDGPGTGRGPAG